MNLFSTIFLTIALIFTPSAFAENISGETSIVIVDNFSVPKTEYYIKHEGKHTKLHFNKNPKWVSGMQVTVKGNHKENFFEVDSATIVEPVIEEVTEGNHNLIVMVLNLGENLYFDANGIIAIEAALVNNNSLYKEASYNKFSFANSKTILLNVPFLTGCPIYELAASADQAAIAAGIDLTLYQNKAYLVPPFAISQCSFLALGEVGGFGSLAPRRSWIKVADFSRLLPLFVHELGHNLGWHHASRDTNNDNINESEYGDGSSVMGICCNIKKFNSYNLARIGWNTPTEIFTDGEFVLTHLGFSDNGNILKIVRPNGGHYYLGFRKKEGWDSTLAAGWDRGVSIHHGGETNNRPHSFYISTPRDGGFFYDGNLLVSQLSHTVDKTIIRVEFDSSGPPPPPPDPLAPPAPDKLRASCRKGIVTLRWRGVREAVNYEIYKEGNLIDQGKSKNAVDLNYEIGTTVLYEVFSVDAEGRLSNDPASLLFSKTSC